MRTPWPAPPQAADHVDDVGLVGPAPHHEGEALGLQTDALPSSATFSNSADGRLSTTNQPRSSGLSAA